MQAIEVRNLQKTYEFHKKESGIGHSVKNLFHRETLYNEAVKRICFSIENGEIVGFLGPNGAGKTTTLKMLSGILFPTSGEASVLGFTPWERKSAFKMLFSIVMAQKNQLWWDLPALDSFVLNKNIYEISDAGYRRTLDELTQLMDVRQYLSVPVRKLSLGERMKMEIIGSLLHRPKVIFMDEPTIGLDLIAQQELRRFIKFYNEQHKTTILLTSHYMDDIESLCQRAIIINDGSIAYDGALSKIQSIGKQKKILKITLPESLDGPKRSALEQFGLVKNCSEANVEMEMEADALSSCISYVMSAIRPRDFTVENTPIEDAITRIYQQGAM